MKYNNKQEVDNLRIKFCNRIENLFNPEDII